MSHQDRDLNEPIVIYDEDNLIVDDFLIAKQRPQSGRVCRQRPLSGKVTHITHNPTTHQLNKRASIEYNNKFCSGPEERQELDRIEKKDKIEPKRNKNKSWSKAI